MKAGLYIRLSINDSLNDSINNQTNILKEYCYINNISIYDIYIDNGYTGTNYNRPEFNRLIRDIEKNYVDTVITKDFSRLGRDYIETGKYIEKYFPENNIRYISILDNYDSNSNIDDYIPFKFIINEMYSKDLSKKIKSGLYAKKKKELFLGSKAPYGYKKVNKYYLEIDDEKCKVVKNIFNLYISGLNSNKLAKILTSSHILTPSGKNIWSTKSVRDILINQAYIGNMVQCKRKRINYKIRKEKHSVKEELIIVEKTHTRIIDINLFNKAQTLINQSKINRKNYLLKNKLICFECGSILTILKSKNRISPYISCPNYRNNKKCKPHTMNYSKIAQFITKFYDPNDIEYILVDNNKNLEIKKKDKIFLR